MMWWLIIHTPDGVFTWPAWGEKDPIDEDLINRARVAAGFPDHDRWATDGSAFDLQLTLGKPHDNLLKRATVGKAEDLRKVDAGAVAKHAEGREADFRRVRREHVAALVADLSDDDLAALTIKRTA
jgi:hypothetical protein